MNIEQQTQKEANQFALTTGNHGDAEAFIAGAEWERERNKFFSYVPYQKCPVCDGNGQIFAGSNISILYKTCDVCNGTKIIPMFSIPEPPKQKED